jgi:hypothetical protein
MAASRSSALVSRSAGFAVASLLVLALAQCASADDTPLVTPSKDYPLPSGVQSWAAVITDVLNNREGGPEQAQKVLQSFQSLVQAQLAKMEKDFKAGGSFPDLPVIQDIKAFQGSIPLKPNNVTALSLSSTFFNYAPCLVSNDMVGAAATAVGLNIVPQLVNIAPRGASILPIGVNINPAVILVNPQGAAIWPRGVNIQPTLIAIAPTGKHAGDAGVNVSPYEIAVTGK